MKPTRTLVHLVATVSALAILSSTGLAESRRFILGVSGTLSESERRDAWTSTLDFVVQKMHPGDRLDTYDASALQPVSTIEIPSDPLFASAKPRLVRLAPQLGRLKAFFDRASVRSGPGTGAIMVPQFLDLVHQIRTGDQPLTVILLTAPFYADEEKAFDFGADGSYPGDGYLRLPTAESPFSTVEKAGWLRNVTIHISWLHEDGRWISDATRHGVLRFWHLYATTQAGVVASAAPSARDVFDRAAQGVSAALLDAVPDPDAKAEMIRIRRIRVETAREQQEQLPSASAGAVQEGVPAWLLHPITASPAAPRLSRGRVKIGLTWGENDPDAEMNDLDLYVIPRPGAKELSFHRMRTAEGKLNKDWLNAPNVTNGFETVELDGEADLAQLSVSVNFYSGHHSGGGVNATLRVWLDGAVYPTTLRIPAATGNRGAAANQRSDDPHWQVIDVLKVVGLRP